MQDITFTITLSVDPAAYDAAFGVEDDDEYRARDARDASTDALFDYWASVLGSGKVRVSTATARAVGIRL